MQVSKEIFSSPEHKLLPTLALYELPKLRETPYEHTGLTWYENIKLALVNRGVPEIAFRLEMEGVGLHGLLNKFRYRRLQEISDEKLADELLSNTVQGPDEHPFGDTVSDAKWCDQKMLHFLLPKVTYVAGDSEFIGVLTLRQFEEACIRYEKNERIIITSEKISSILSKCSGHWRGELSFMRSQVIELVNEVKDFKTWSEQQLKDAFGMNLVCSTVFTAFYETLYPKNRAKSIEELRASIEFSGGGAGTDVKELMEAINGMAVNLIRQIDRDALEENQREKAKENGTLRGLKHGLNEASSKPNKRHKKTPHARAKTLENIQRMMINQGLTSVSEIQGPYATFLKHCPQHEVDEYLSPENLMTTSIDNVP
ncbi:hypothetical protein TRICI_005642 [Trichomonascus ciferrii]|uniref:Uncharacterized protein n=1 Tax=Trichomonascus ciferrii TaxID=44093 RepID=A0A642URA3_9ASCO|nr:hypothetical protein TRICI_005642 [Trichomonascus ciferrii]